MTAPHAPGQRHPARRGTVLAAAALAALVTLASCGIPLDRGPKDVADATDLATQGAPVASGTADSPRIYFVAPDTQNGVRLQQVTRDVPATANDVLGALFKGLTGEERKRQLTTQIPVGTKLQSVAVVDGAVVVSVDRTFLAKTNLSTAVAQIVYTATALPGIERVRLLVDNAPYSWPAGDGRQRDGDLTPLAYPALYPASEPDLPPVPSPTGPTTVPPTTLPPPATTTLPPGPTTTAAVGRAVAGATTTTTSTTSSTSTSSAGTSTSTTSTTTALDP